MEYKPVEYKRELKELWRKGDLKKNAREISKRKANIEKKNTAGNEEIVNIKIAKAGKKITEEEKENNEGESEREKRKKRRIRTKKRERVMMGQERKGK